MALTDHVPGMDAEVKVKLQEACDRVAKREQIPSDERKAAAARIDARRAANENVLGVQNVVVDLVRQSRER